MTELTFTIPRSLWLTANGRYLRDPKSTKPGHYTVRLVLAPMERP